MFGDDCLGIVFTNVSMRLVCRGRCVTWVNVRSRNLRLRQSANSEDDGWSVFNEVTSSISLFFRVVYNQWSIQPTTIVYWSSECFIIDAGLFFKCTTSRSKWQIIRSWVMKQALWIAVMERNQLNVFTELSIIRFLFSVTKPRPNMIDFCKPDGKTWVCICQVCPHSASAVSEEFVLCGDTLVSIACLWAWRSRVWIHLVIFFLLFFNWLGLNLKWVP